MSELTDCNSREQIKAAVLAMRGKKSFSLIARDLGISRNAVAGLLFRQDHAGQRTTGTGRHGGGHKYAKECLLMGSPPRFRRPRSTRIALGQIIERCRDENKGQQRLCEDILEIAEWAVAKADKARDLQRARKGW